MCHGVVDVPGRTSPHRLSVAAFFLLSERTEATYPK